MERWAEEHGAAATVAQQRAHSLVLSHEGRKVPRAEEEAARATLASLEEDELGHRRDEEELRGLAGKLRILLRPVAAAATSP